MKRILMLLLLPVFLCLFASATTKVLFIGNSFTSTHNMPAIFESIAKAAGHTDLKVVSHAPGGAYVAYTPQGTFAHANNPAVYNLINSDDWDFISVQDNQGWFIVYPIGDFSIDTAIHVVDGHQKLQTAMKNKNSCARMLLFSGWIDKDGAPDWQLNGPASIQRVYDNYKALNNSLDEIISPLSVAWLRAIKELPNVDLWSADKGHPSYAGSYLNAAVYFATIFRQRFDGINFNGSLDAATAKKMREIAYQAVADSITATGLGKFSPSLSYTGTTLTAATGYTKYEWYFNGTLLTTTTANTTAAANKGCYQVVAIDSKGCKYRSMEKCEVTTTLKNIYNESLSLEVYPNPATEMVKIGLPVADASMNNGILTDLSGRVLQAFSFSSNVTSLDINTLSEGIYLISVQSGEKVYRVRVVKN